MLIDQMTCDIELVFVIQGGP